jgi:hypothetical protein
LTVLSICWCADRRHARRHQSGREGAGEQARDGQQPRGDTAQGRQRLADHGGLPLQAHLQRLQDLEPALVLPLRPQARLQEALRRRGRDRHGGRPAALHRQAGPRRGAPILLRSPVPRKVNRRLLDRPQL